MTFNKTSAANEEGGVGENKLATFCKGKIIVHIINNKIPMNCYTRQQCRGLV